MFRVLNEIGFAAAGIATFASFILGALWFAVLLAKPCRVALGRQNSPKAKPAPIFLVGPRRAAWLPCSRARSCSGP